MSAVSGRTVAEWTLRAGRRLQHDAAEVVRGALAGDADLGRRALRFLLTTAEESAAGAGLFVDDNETRLAWVELRNKVEAFRVFEHVDALLGVRVEDHALADLARRVSRLAPPLSVWAAEGVGYHVTAARCRGLVTPRNLFICSGEALPSWLFVALYAGMGSALATHVLDPVRADPRAVRVEAAIEQFVAWCAANADADHRDVALEALGFVARGMFGELLPAVSTCSRFTRPLSSLVWHGVGRAMYFAPTSALPLSDTRRRVLDELARVPSDAGGRANAVAGFAWGATLVNLRDPSVLEPFAIEAGRLQIEQPFAQGIHDALDAWRRCAPGDTAAAAFRLHQPCDLRRRTAWIRLMHAASPRRVQRAGELFSVTDDGVAHA